MPNSHHEVERVLNAPLAQLPVRLVDVLELLRDDGVSAHLVGPLVGGEDPDAQVNPLRRDLPRLCLPSPSAEAFDLLQNHGPFLKRTARLRDLLKVRPSTQETAGRVMDICRELGFHILALGMLWLPWLAWRVMEERGKFQRVRLAGVTGGNLWHLPAQHESHRTPWPWRMGRHPWRS